MKRRTLFGLPLVSFFGRFRPQQLPPLDVPPAAPRYDLRSRPAPFGPTMEQLIGLAECDPVDRGHYVRLLDKALGETGPVASDVVGFSVIYHIGPIYWPDGRRCRSFISRSDRVPVPESLLPYFRPDDRGEEFPRGVPYKRMP
jgi:hypothetical protein